MGETIKELISENEIDKKIRQIGEQISSDYRGEEIVLVIVLKGASFFGCELAKRISSPLKMDFMATGSYGSGTVSNGNVKIKKEMDMDPEGKNIIIVEDIVDSGNTLTFLVEYFKEKNVKSIKTCALLDKPDRREVEINADYTGFEIPDEFVVGYGLDYDQKYRNLPYVGIVEFDS